MSELFVKNFDEVKNVYKEKLFGLNVDEQKAPIKKVHNGKEYTYYGKAIVNRTFYSKMTTIFQIMGASFLVAITLGILLAAKPFRLMLLRKISKLSEPNEIIRVFLLEFMKNQPLKNVVIKAAPNKEPPQKVNDIDAHLINDNLDETHRIIGRMSPGVDTDALRLKLAEAYLKKGQLDIAFSIIYNVLFDNEAKETFLAKLSIDFHKKNDKEGTIDCLDTILRLNFEKALLNEKRQDPKVIDLETYRKGLDKGQAISDFYDKLDRQIYDKIQDELKNGDQEKILKAIKEIVQDPQIQHEYCNKKNT